MQVEKNYSEILLPYHSELSAGKQMVKERSSVLLVQIVPHSSGSPEPSSTYWDQHCGGAVA
jgi:hypothetical protein